MLVGDVSGKGLEVAAVSAMVRFFVEARAWDSEHPAEVLAQANRILRMRLQSGGFATAFLAMVSDGRVRYCNAGHPPPCLLRADGGAESLEGSGLPLGIEEDGRHEEREIEIGLGDVLFAATDGLLETRREGAFFSDERLPGLLAEFGRTEPPQAFVERVFAAAQEWAPVLHDDVVVLALRARRSSSCATSPPPARPRRRCTGSTWGSCASDSGPASCPRSRSSPPSACSRRSARRSSSSTRAGGPSAAAACARSARSSAEIKRMFVTADAVAAVTAGGCSPSSSGARPRRGRSGCGCSRPRC